MAEYRVTSPDGKQYRVTGPDGASDAEVLAQVKDYKPAAAPAAAAPKEAPAEPESTTAGFVGGNLNKGIAGIAGMPVDAMRNLMNLGIAGAGTVSGAFGGPMPQPLKPGPGSSEWFEGLGKKTGMIGPSAEPESPGGRYAAAGIQAIPSALMGKPSMGQLPRAVTGAVTSGVGSQLGQDVAPEGWKEFGSVAGGVAPGTKGMIPSPPRGERATSARQAERFGQAKELGIPVAPREMKPDKAQQKIQDAANKQLKLPEGTEPTAKVLEDYRAAHYKESWQPIINEPALKGVINSTTDFKRKVRTIAKEEAKLREEFPGSVKDVGLEKVTDDFLNSPYFTTQGAMDQIKRLRESSTKNLSSASSTDDSTRLGLVQRKIAKAMEDLVEENLKDIGKPDLIKNFRESRVAMAQSHAIQASLDPATGKINGRKLAAMQTEGEPLSGQLKKIATVSAAFPGAVKAPPTEDLFTHRVTPMAIENPAALAAHWGTRMADPLTKSRPYQHMFVDPSSKLTPDQQRIMRLMIGTQQIPEPPQQ